MRNLILASSYLKPHPLNRGLVGWWPCEFTQGGFGGYTLRDIGGNNLHGSMTGASSSYRVWKTDSPINHNGNISAEATANRYFRVPANPIFHLQFPYSLSLWSKTSTGSATVLIDVGAATEWSLQWTAASDSLALHSGGFGTLIGVATAALDDGVWRHYIFVGRQTGGGGGDAYVNGEDDTGTSNPTTPIYGGTEQLDFLSRGGTFPYTGSIADVRMYNRALTAQEAMALYIESKNGNPNLITHAFDGAYNLTQPSVGSLFRISQTGSMNGLGSGGPFFKDALA